MKASVQFYRDVLGMELVYGGEQGAFSSLRPKGGQSAVLNLEQGDTVTRWVAWASMSPMWMRSGCI